MLDINYNIKLIDFGFAASLQEKELLKTYLGTYGYMAPEQHLGRQYNGAAVDVFAIGVIFFLIYAGHPPFNAATSKDPYYILLAKKSYDDFWKKALLK
jgi:serine/threonine protein kinase